ncbi:MAG TPA: histidine--tRNA ligase [Acidimicrobiia bacterium]|nr:histidine--tRNA ligase [Acidimicrobiia bacterium]
MTPFSQVFRAPKGTHDILPPASRRFAAFVDAFSARADRFGYGLAVTPLFEHLEVFLRVGESTDIVKKEMYEFADKGNRRLALRPEGTASVVRAFVEHRPTEPWKVFYSAPNFRYERPQKGRYRQHWQVGAEVVGAPDPDLDIEVIDLAAGFFASLGLSRVRLRLNSMGDAKSRGTYVGRLREYLAPHVSTLGDDFGRMLADNPLRILDSKNPAVIDVVDRAPQLPEHLSAEAAGHFEQVQAGLRALGIPFELEPRLVRGFDYYTGTTFEFAAESLDAAQDAIGGGGRYDGLAAEMGGPDVSGIGFGIGIERALLACDAEGVFPAATPPLDVFVVDRRVDLTGPEAAVLLHELRVEGLRVEQASGGRSEKAQWKLAARHEARFTVVLESGAVELTVRERSTGEEHKVSRELVVGWLYERATGSGRSAPGSAGPHR